MRLYGLWKHNAFAVKTKPPQDIGLTLPHKTVAVVKYFGNVLDR